MNRKLTVGAVIALVYAMPLLLFLRLRPLPPALTIDPGKTSGPADAKVTLYEFSDFSCPSCRMLALMLRSILKDYPNQVRLVYKHYPLNIHPDSRLKAHAADCAARQGDFWRFHDLLFATQFVMIPEKDARPAMMSYAKRMGMDTEKFGACLDDKSFHGTIDADIKEGNRYGVSGTPTLIVNGNYVLPVLNRQSIIKAIDQGLGRKK